MGDNAGKKVEGTAVGAVVGGVTGAVSGAIVGGVPGAIAGGVAGASYGGYQGYEHAANRGPDSPAPIPATIQERLGAGTAASAGNQMAASERLALSSGNTMFVRAWSGTQQVGGSPYGAGKSVLGV